MATKRADLENISLADADMATLEKYERFLLSQREEEEQEERLTALFKTVDAFAGIMNRKMWVKSSPAPYTDGYEIGVPFKDKRVYEYGEHELAHNLFMSNFRAKEMFCEEYVKQIAAALAQDKVTLDAHARGSLGQMIGMLLNVLEDHRVNSLWAMLYPGSYKRIMDAGTDLLQKLKAQAHEELLAYFLLIAYDVKNIPSGPFDRFGPAMVAALKKVERKGPSASFVVGKWLMTQLVSEIIRQLRQLPPPPSAGKARVQTDLDQMGQPGNNGGDDTDDENQNEGKDNADGDSESKDSGAASSWQPPDVQAERKDRVEALKKLISVAQQQAQGTKNGFDAAKARLSDVQANRFNNKGTEKEARDLVKAAMDTNVVDNDSLNDHLATSQQDMEEVIEGLKDALEQVREMTEDEWITRDAHARVRFVDVNTNPANVVTMSEEDKQATRRLKELFQRVKQRTSKMLTDSGHEIDIEAYINNKVGKCLNPVFKTEQSGRGFKTLILVDRSSSMAGPRAAQTERATRILRRALKAPNVQFHVWGFNSTDASVQLTRIGDHVDLQNEGRMAVNGTTPMHIAARTAVNWLSHGHEKKQLIVLTDGMPCFTSSAGKNYGETQLTKMVGEEIERARKQGINVTTLIVGSEVSDEAARTMFGERRNWIRAEEDTLSKKLVNVVTSSFVQYLSAG